MESPKFAESEIFTAGRALIYGSEILAAAGIENARLDAELLLRFVLDAERADLYSHLDAPLDAAKRRRFEQILWRRCRHEPTAYITGQKEFWSLDFSVTPAVLIPRPETELLVEIALELIENLAGPVSLLDLGTGSGAIAVCLAKARVPVEIFAVDISRPALDVARANARRHDAHKTVHFVQADLFEAIAPLGQFNLIVANPPYIKRGTLAALAADVRDWEPRQALDGGADGLDFYRRIVAGADRYLREDGQIVLEIGADMGAPVARLFNESGRYRPVLIRRDYAGCERVVSARKIP